MLPKSKSLLVLAFVISGLILIGAGYLNHSGLRLLSDTRIQGRHARDTLVAIDSYVAAVLDAETGQRGYLLTEKPEYLEPYTQATRDLPSRLAALAQLAAGDSDAQRNLADLGSAAHVKLDELAETIRLNDSGDRAGALRLVLTDAGKHSMDRVRSVAETMRKSARTQYENALAAAEQARALTFATGWATAGLALALLGLLAVIVKRDTAQLRSSEMQLAITLRSIGDAVIATDADGAITLMNPVAEQLTGWKLGEARSQPLESVFRIMNEHTRATVESPVTKVLREGTVVALANHTLLIRRDGSETPIADSGAPLLSPKGEVLGVVLVFRDASQERDMERDMREADRRKDEFLATLSHELRNPLAPVRQALGIMRAPTASAAQTRWSIEVIERQVQNMGRLLDDLLDISRVTLGTLEIRKGRVALSTVIDAAIELARPVIEGKHHHLSVAYPVDLMVNVDSLRLAQVLGNLLTNAAKYTDPHGELELKGNSDGPKLTLSVTDNGIGISPEMLPRIFEMFVQVKDVRDRAEGGLGIGLALAKGLIDLHGGTIEVLSQGEGRGSQFVIHLPLKAEASQPAPRPALAIEGTAPGVRIVVADDNVDAAESLAMLLNLHGHEVRVANDGEAALQLLETFQPRFAIVDVGMPRLNGHEVAARARAASWGAGITLIALTGWGQESDRRAALGAGFDYHFVKPVDIDDVMRAITMGRPRPTAEDAQSPPASR